MSRDIYMFDIVRTDDQKLLRSIRKEALADDLLSLLECTQILAAADSRLVQLKVHAKIMRGMK